MIDCTLVAGFSFTSMQAAQYLLLRLSPARKQSETAFQQIDVIWVGRLQIFQQSIFHGVINIPPLHISAGSNSDRETPSVLLGWSYRLE